MAYSDVETIEARMARFPVGSTRTLKPEQLDQIVADIAAEIDSIVDSLGGTVPITSPAWFVTRLRALNSDGATAIALKSILPEAQGPGQSPAYAFYEERYRAGIRLLLLRGLPTALTTRLSASTYFTRNPDEEATLGDLAGDHLFSVKKDW